MSPEFKNFLLVQTCDVYVIIFVGRNVVFDAHITSSYVTRLNEQKVSREFHWVERQGGGMTPDPDPDPSSKLPLSKTLQLETSGIQQGKPNC